MSTNRKLPRILLVDDHRDTVHLTALFLVKHGFEVVQTYSVSEARLEAAQNNCGIVISDSSMPDGDGIELMRELKAKYGMAGILVSGTADVIAVENEGFRFLPKPMNLKTLLDALHSIATGSDG